MYVLSGQAGPPPHEGDVSKPRKLSEPRRPQTQEDAVMHLLAEVLWGAQDVRGKVRRGRALGSAHRLPAGHSPPGRSTSPKQSWWKRATHFLRYFRGAR